MSDEPSRPSPAEVRETLDAMFGLGDETFDDLGDAPDGYLIALLYAFDSPANELNEEATLSRVSSAVHILREQGYVVDGGVVDRTLGVHTSES